MSSSASPSPADPGAVSPGSVWALFSAKHLAASLMLGGGVALYAIETYVTATVMPSVVRDIGGLHLFAWTTTLYVAAAVLGSIFTAVRPRGMSLKQTYLLGAVAFGLGSLACGLAPTMEIVLGGRSIQGFGAGLLATVAYAFIRYVYPDALWNKASTLYAAIWGIATFLGPTIGGWFSQGSDWRDAFYVLIPFSLAMIVAAWRLLPTAADDRTQTEAPMRQILMLLAAVLLVSTAGSVDDIRMRGAFIIAAIAAAAATILLEQRARLRLLPRSAVSLKAPIARVYLIMVLLLTTMACDIYIPYFLQELHGVKPLMSGYLVALVALGWTMAAFVSSNFSGRGAAIAIAAGAAVEAISTLALLFLLGRDNPQTDVVVIVAAVFAMLGMGFGVGLGWAHLVSHILRLADGDEKDKASAGITTMQSLGTAFGAALAGVVVNATGLIDPGGVAGSISAAQWLYGLFVIPACLAVVTAMTLLPARRP